MKFRSGLGAFRLAAAIRQFDLHSFSQTTFRLMQLLQDDISTCPAALGRHFGETTFRPIQLWSMYVKSKQQCLFARAKHRAGLVKLHEPFSPPEPHQCKHCLGKKQTDKLEKLHCVFRVFYHGLKPSNCASGVVK